MPIDFEVYDTSGKSHILTTSGCGSCKNFWHRSNKAGGCSEHHKKGELSIMTDKCIFWKLKDKYRKFVQWEIDGVL